MTTRPARGSEFLVAGIAASADGIEALQEFLAHVPSDSGIAYVVILHPSPDDERRLPGILQAVSSIPVARVEHAIRLEPDRVYVISPRQSLGLADGMIVPSARPDSGERRAPVDGFLRALAESHGRHAAAVLLSGTGDDGAAGLTRIKERGGLTVVQDPGQAAHADLPRHGIATGQVDDVLPVADIPGRLIVYTRTLGGIRLPAPRTERHATDERPREDIFAQLRRRTLRDFANARRARVQRRIERRMRVRQVADVAAGRTTVVVTARRTTDGRLLGFTTFSRELTERKALEEALRRSRQGFERRVRTRTAELHRLNLSLQAEVAERRVAEAHIKALFTKLVTVQEDERRRVAREVHDDLGQQITALRLAIDALAATSATGEDPRIARLADLALELDRSVDFLTAGLRPASLDHLGLGAALASLATQSAERFGFAVAYDVTRAEGVRLSPDAEANVYRIAQEALHNVAKHAGATRVTLMLERRDGRLLLTVEDDGVGFNPDDVARAGASGLGLIGMRERAALAGGECQVESAPGAGTTVFVRVPV